MYFGVEPRLFTAFDPSTSSLLDCKQPPSCPAQNVLMGYHSVKGHEAKTRRTRSDQVAGAVPLNQEMAYSVEMKLPLLFFYFWFGNVWESRKVVGSPPVIL